MYLFLDTETTGVTPQDRIVSICCAFYDSGGAAASTTYSLIRPEGFTIPPGATAIHGITTERALQDGHSLESTLDSVSAEITQRSPRTLVGHNVSFDRAMVMREFARAKKADPISKLRTFCTMKETADICRLPGKYGDFKWPRLAELHRHLFGRTMDGAHDARADVDACARCYFELKRLGMRLE